jgi:hypothetical protein
VWAKEQLGAVGVEDVMNVTVFHPIKMTIFDHLGLA